MLIVIFGIVNALSFQLEIEDNAMNKELNRLLKLIIENTEDAIEQIDRDIDLENKNKEKCSNPQDLDKYMKDIEYLSQLLKNISIKLRKFQ